MASMARGMAGRGVVRLGTMLVVVSGIMVATAIAVLAAEGDSADRGHSGAVGVPRINESGAITFIRTMEEVFGSGDGEAIKAFYREHYLEDAEITLTITVRIGGAEQGSQTWTSTPEEQIASVDYAIPKDFWVEIKDIRVALDRQSATVRYDSFEIAEVRVSDGTRTETVETRTEGDCTARLVAGYDVMKIGDLTCDAVLMPNQ